MEWLLLAFVPALWGATALFGGGTYAGYKIAADEPDKEERERTAMGRVIIIGAVLAVATFYIFSRYYRRRGG